MGKINQTIRTISVITVLALLLILTLPQQSNAANKPLAPTSISDPLLPSPFSWEFPDHVKHCETHYEDLLLFNYTASPLTYTYLVIENPSAYSNWLDAQNFDGLINIAPNDFDTGQVILNQGGTVCNPGTVTRLAGRIRFIANAVDTSFAEIDLVIADTVIFPVWDSVTTNCGLQLAVGNNGNFGNQGVGGLNMDYVDNGEWRPDDYDVYLYDASTVIGWIEGNDTIVNYAMYDVDIRDSVSLLPQGGESHSSTSWANIYYSGVYTTNDTSISISSKWYTPRGVSYECNFIIKHTKVSSNVGALTSLMIGELVDWDVPGDSISSNNSSSTTTSGPYSVIYQQGIEMPGYDDSLEAADGGWDNNERYGAIMYLAGVSTLGGDTTKISNSPHGMYTADNATYVYPNPLGLDGEQIYQNMSTEGTSLSDSTGDLHTGISYVFDHSIADGETLHFYTAYVTIMKSSARASLSSSLDNARTFFIEHLTVSYPGCFPGDVNCDWSLDISDLTYTVDFMFRGGSPPCDYESADVNNDCSLDITDLTYRVDFMFRGGAPPLCGCID